MTQSPAYVKKAHGEGGGEEATLPGDAWCHVKRKRRRILDLILTNPGPTEDCDSPRLLSAESCRRPNVHQY